MQTPSSTQVCLRILDGAGEEQDEPAEGRAANDDGSFSDGPGQPRRLEGEFASSTVNLGQGVSTVCISTATARAQMDTAQGQEAEIRGDSRAARQRCWTKTISRGKGVTLLSFPNYECVGGRHMEGVSRLMKCVAILSNC